MTDDPGKEIRGVFGKALLEHDAARHLNADERAVYLKIQQEHSAQVRFEEHSFELEYQTRFEVARKRIIDEGGSKDLKLVHRWFGSDNFDAAAIDRQADRVVRHEHSALLAQLEQDRRAEINALLDVVERRRDAGERFKQDFARATDRRSGQERRRGPAR